MCFFRWVVEVVWVMWCVLWGVVFEYYENVVLVVVLCVFGIIGCCGGDDYGGVFVG